LYVRVWFDTLAAYDGAGAEIPLDVFTAGGERWWNAMYSGDERTKSSGIYPLGGNESAS
jgi:hypothetical protein